MKSYGIEITEEQVAAGLAVMARPFKAMELEGALRRAGVPEEANPSRVADKLLQRERKAGRIRFTSNRWEPVS